MDEVKETTKGVGKKDNESGREEKGKAKENQEIREYHAKGNKKGVKEKYERTEGKRKDSEKQIRDTREYKVRQIKTPTERNSATMRTREKRIQLQTASTARREYILGRTKRILKSNNTPRWEYTTRCDVKVKLPQDGEGDTTIALRDASRHLLVILVETGDPTTAILP